MPFLGYVALQKIGGYDWSRRYVPIITCCAAHCLATFNLLYYYCNFDSHLLGRTILSFEMIIGQEIDRIMRTFGKGLPSKKEKELLNETLQLCEHYSYACSRAVKLVPMRAILMAIILEHGKKIEALVQQVESLSL